MKRGLIALAALAALLALVVGTVLWLNFLDEDTQPATTPTSRASIAKITARLRAKSAIDRFTLPCAGCRADIAVLLVLILVVRSSALSRLCR